MVLALVVDSTWASLASFDIDGPAYLLVGAAAAACATGSLFYGSFRRDEKLHAMLFGTFFLIAFAASFGVLNYLLLTVAGPRIDQELASIDRMLGIDWPALLRFAEQHPTANLLLFLVYASSLAQTAVLVNALGLCGRPNDIYAFCLSLAIGAAVTIGIWTVAPSFGAFTVYPIGSSPPVPLMADAAYARDLLELAANGPGRISPLEVKGLVAFPSFHTVLALLIAWYAWPLKWLRWPAIGLNALVILSIPIQGGHHIIDIAGGFVVAVFAIAVTSWASRHILSRRHSVPVRVPEPAGETA
ncbi:phosphatase PAP2 family protein [Methyloceanibacter sp.]|uniref:phosphatase PAP2 family protein n=1 Tax=Methyloceanibacter sp. TaxID=1965321 RepID=UPI002D40AD30|nr:phosphatase PAP2 family protein [Methyloceanibacter sp.]HZP10266.1 phosphatase PAP2 family protein [Methyloceanibacter sp.]